MTVVCRKTQSQHFILLYHNCGGIDNRAEVNYNRSMERKTKIWILLLAAGLVVACGLWWCISSGSAGGTVAVISVDGEELYRIDLSAVKESYTLDIDTQWGHNTVLVSPGEISVTEADCPDHICVQRGCITGAGIPIICMPHRLIIEIEGGELYV